MAGQPDKWIDWARRDLRAAEGNLGISEFHVAAFLSQQAAEKALKALLIKRSGKLERVHDLVRLVRGLKASKEIIERCKRLDRVYVATRYPDAGGQVSEPEARELVEDAKEVIK